MRLKMKDIIIMAVLTIIYFLVAIVNLGTREVPQRGFTPKAIGESFTVKLPKKCIINNINYYLGLGFDRELEITLKVCYKDENGDFVEISKNGKTLKIEKEPNDVFCLRNIQFKTIATDTLKFEFLDIGGEINELAIYELRSVTPIKGIQLVEYTNEDAKYLFDEQDKMPYKSTYKNSTYFDEVYHARTAYEHIHNIMHYENTHPPLGKLLIALGIKIFGMNPFGWRIVGTMFGVFMVPIMYLFGLKIFKQRIFAFSCAFLMMCDCMHFTQTRIATIDVYVTFFVILMYYWMFDVYMNKSFDNPKVYYRSFALAGLMFGLGISSKWIAMYSSVGLFVLFILSKYREYKTIKDGKIIKKDLVKILIYGSICFVLVPITIYCMSYIPILPSEGEGAGLIETVVSYIKHMYIYHTKSVLDATHPFGSKWYEWPIIKCPIWYYEDNNLPFGLKSVIVAIGNPAIWWLSIVAFVYTIIVSIKKKDKKMVPIIVAVCSQYIPWMFVSRVTFIYHFFSIVPFAIIMIVYMFYNLKKYKIWSLSIYLVIVMIIFIRFYPILSGMIVTGRYINKLKWLKNWVF